MKVLDPGHKYAVDYYDNPSGMVGQQLIQFMKRDQHSHPNGHYPGNVGSHPGTNIQEVLRVLIDRVEYLDKQIPCNENQLVLYYLRHSIYLLEQRAAQRRNGLFLRKDISRIEEESTCRTCGHLDCTQHTKEFTL